VELERSPLLTGVEEFLIFGFIPLLIGIFAAPSTETAPEPVISGKLVVPPSLRLADDAVATVELVELRRGETAMPALACQSIGWRGGTPQQFAIRFDPGQIRPTGSYALRARIMADATVCFETPYPEPAAPLSGEPVMLVLAPAALA
jgi:putative lipoprotein